MLPLPLPACCLAVPGDRPDRCEFPVVSGVGGFRRRVRRAGSGSWSLVPRRAALFLRREIAWFGTPSDAQIQSAVMRGPIARVVPAVLVP